MEHMTQEALNAISDVIL